MVNVIIQPERYSVKSEKNIGEKELGNDLFKTQLRTENIDQGWSMDSIFAGLDYYCILPY